MGWNEQVEFFGGGHHTGFRTEVVSTTDEPSGRNLAYPLLQRSLDRGRLGHAYLFTGESLETLEGAAVALASAVMCLAPPVRGTVEAEEAGGRGLRYCGECLHCRRIQNRLHPDVLWVRPESRMRQIQADQMRELIQAMQLKPMETPHKFGILSGADRMNASAANAFLKTLEEPPPRTVLLLLSTEPQRLLETILSRCLRLHFGEAMDGPPAGVMEWLGRFSARAGEGGGGVFARYQLLGGMVAGLQAMRSEIEAALTALSPLERFPDASPEQRERWESELNAAIESEYRRRRSDWLGAMEWWLRDVWLSSHGVGGDRLRFPAMAAGTAAVASRIEPRMASANLEIWGRTQRMLHTNVQEALALEVGLLQLRF